MGVPQQTCDWSVKGIVLLVHLDSQCLSCRTHPASCRDQEEGARLRFPLQCILRYGTLLEEEGKGWRRGAHSEGSQEGGRRAVEEGKQPVSRVLLASGDQAAQKEEVVARRAEF